MRNPWRIPTFMEELTYYWQKYCPDWRFGQLMYNFIATMGDPFYWEEDKFMEKFEEFLYKEFKGVDASEFSKYKPE